MVSQTQSDPSVSFFEMPLPVKVTGSNGETAFLVLENTSNAQLFSKPLNFQVVNVEFNYEKQIIEKNSTVVFDDALSTESASKNEVMLFPNPVSDRLNMKGIKKTSDFEIFSTDGKLIRKGKYSPSKTIDVSSLKVGVYFLKINTKSFKFVKE